MLNRVILVGRLTKDPELRYTPSGVAVANFTLAVNRTFSNQQGEREADFINCVVWRKPAENVANYLKKGSLAGVDGRIQTRSYDNNEGRRVFITEVVAESVQFLEPRGASQGQGNAYAGGGAPTGGNDYSRQNQQPDRQSGGFNDDPFANDGKPIDISDDDLPF
ncbi:MULTISPECIES: single-stranded DNA-binding protein [Alkalihalophilus]|jgi:single-strand DNA-binding protein|uniref:Single-stranded DNA-binding protein n=3 Tax=Alkalihalophilus TaxID=2893060 RepID=D3FQF9_ALKPO|nr:MULTISPECIES: single-stranded DNA-binding protein [Alkalihalophilus]ADC49631.1 single-strand DNA-binding protein (phage-related protein) [Alkalihalophilus pseudofirmus OF4]ERN52943.1 single-stranded DNA-binding protein [Alkalihalophilus marmarensis DSM 21297]MCM3490802.1 single-stranded DNA-binding protein [Alkalihalophilus marmarensis]MDV2887344.1 single-stranded DNA-binding protein [Alkalihalophilus pseudofirmus]MEC2071457.1 single-stranded DNA-binding protein [Alkalihalophilus marmarensi